MDLSFEQLWDKFISQDISVSASIETNNTRLKRRDIETLTALIQAGDREKSQELLTELFLSTPVWNPLAVTTLLQKTAEYFYSIGQYADAILFAERGLQWDPVHPELIALLCKSNVSLNPERSLYYLGFIRDAGYHESLLSGYTPPENVQSEKSYVPESGTLSKINNDQLFKFLVYQAAALHRRPLFETIDALRSHSLACMAGGHLQMALVAIRLSLFRLKDPLYISGLNPVVIQIKSKWARIIESLICNLLDSDVKAKALLGNIRISERLYDRKNAIEDLVSAKNLQGLFCFVMDPVPEISFLACQYLIEFGQEKPLVNYVTSASQLALDNKEVYGDLKPHLLLRSMKTAVNISPKISASNDGLVQNNSMNSNELATETTIVKKIVRKKIGAKDAEPEDLAPVKKKTVVKKVVRKSAKAD